MSRKQVFRKALSILVALQGGIYICYLFIGIDGSGGETPIQRFLFIFYFPVILALIATQEALQMHSWASLGFVMYFGPLLGAIVYSLGVASIAACFAKKADSTATKQNTELS
jgi:hypothetical protein